MKVVVMICRILVGSLFIVSGLIKANDAWGFFYKLQEYFEPGAFNMPAMDGIGLELAIFTCVAEILLGIALLTGAKMKLTVVLSLFMMVFFTWLTGYTSTCDPHGETEIANAAGEIEMIANQCVLECGCFGNAIPLEPKESFIKDIVIMIFLVPISIWTFMGKVKLNEAKEDLFMFVGSLVVTAWFSMYMLDWVFPVLFTAISLLVATGIKKRFDSKHKEWYMAIGIVIVCGFFQYMTLNHLPMKDYRAYAVGENVRDNMKSAEELGVQGPVLATPYDIRNKITGKDSTILSTDWLKVYNTDWFKNTYGEPTNYDNPSIVIEEGYEPSILDFQIVTYEGDDLTEEKLAYEGYTFWHVSNTLEKSHACAQVDLNALAAEAQKSGHEFYAITNALYDDAETYRHDNQCQYPFYNCDQTELKIVVRSNPGLVLLKDATVLKKWAWKDIPTWEEAMEVMKSN